MRSNPDAQDRNHRVQVAAVAALGVALLAAAVIGTYEASLAKAHAVHAVVRDAVPGTTPSAVQYLPGSTAQIPTIEQPRTEGRRAELRAALDGDEAPVEAFDRLRSIPGRDEEARKLLAEFWDRKALLAENPIHRVLYALQALVVADDEPRRRMAGSALAALGPLRMARHVAEGPILSCDPRTLVVRGSGYLHVLHPDTGATFDVAVGDAADSLADGNRMVTWSDGTARVWDVGDLAPEAPIASLPLQPDEVPLAFSGSAPGGCVLTSRGRVWRGDDRPPTTVAHGRWTAGSVDPACDRVVLHGTRSLAYRRRGKGWVEARGVVPELEDGATAPCEGKTFSPDRGRFLCRESASRIATYTWNEAARDWTRTEAELPPMGSVVLQNDGAICGSLAPVAGSDAAATDRSDVLFLAPEACPAPPPVERAWGSIRVRPAGAVFTYPPAGPAGATNVAFFGFDGRGASMAGVSNAWFGPRKDEQLLEHEATSSEGEKTYELAGALFDPAAALPDPRAAMAVQIEDAHFVPSPQPSLVFEVSYRSRPDPGSSPRRAVARWDLSGARFCGPAMTGGLTSVAPNGDAIAIDGHVYRVPACTREGGLEPTDITGALALGPGAVRWIGGDGESLELRAAQGASARVPVPEKGRGLQIAFNPNGDRFFVRTAGTLCKWAIAEGGALALDGCRWSDRGWGGWASDAAWVASDEAGETVAVFDRTAEGAALREFFGTGDQASEAGESSSAPSTVACLAAPRAKDTPLTLLRTWEERLGHRFRQHGTSLEESRHIESPEIVPRELAP
jgi:hypothetical protein